MGGLVSFHITRGVETGGMFGACDALHSRTCVIRRVQVDILNLGSGYVG